MKYSQRDQRHQILSFSKWSKWSTDILPFHGDQIHPKEVRIILRSRNTIVKPSNYGERSREKNQGNKQNCTRIILSIKLCFFIFILWLQFIFVSQIICKQTVKKHIYFHNKIQNFLNSDKLVCIELTLRWCSMTFSFVLL